VAYAPAAARAGLTALFALDERLGSIVAATSEPTIGLMRLTWWRDALERLDSAAVPPEPLLAALAEVVARGVPGAAIAGIEDGWAALIDGEPDDEAIARHGRERGGTLFATIAQWLGASDDGLSQAGAGWALADLGHRHSVAAVRDSARRQARDLLAPLAGRRWPRPALPLAALVLLAARDAAEDGARRQGAPGRLLRLLALRLLGR
jgi:phytoene synthase